MVNKEAKARSLDFKFLELLITSVRFQLEMLNKQDKNKGN